MGEEGRPKRRGRGAAPARDPVDVHVGRRVHARRIALGLSREELGWLVGLTAEQVGRYERGAASANPVRLWLFGEALEVEPASFFQGLSGAPDPTPLGELIRAFAAIGDARLRAELLALIRAIADQAEP